MFKFNLQCHIEGQIAIFFNFWPWIPLFDLENDLDLKNRALEIISIAHGIWSDWSKTSILNKMVKNPFYIQMAAILDFWYFSMFKNLKQDFFQGRE